MNYETNTNACDDFAASMEGMTLEYTPQIAYTADDLEIVETLAEGKDLGLLNRKEWAAIYRTKRGSQLAHNLRAHMKALGIKGSVSESSGYGTTVKVKYAADEEAAEAMISRYSSGYWDGQTDSYQTTGGVFSREFGGSCHIRVKVAEEKIAEVEESPAEVANRDYTYEQINGCSEVEALERKGLAMGLVKVCEEEYSPQLHRNAFVYNLGRELKAAGIKATVSWNSYPIIKVKEAHRLAAADKVAARHTRDFCTPRGEKPWCDMFGGTRFIRVELAS